MFWLQPDWICAPHIDFEYKKYLALAYVKSLENHFKQREVYPYLSDVRNHLNLLRILEAQMRNIEEQGPKNLVGINLDPPILRYKSAMKFGDTMRSVLDTIQFVLPLFQTHEGDGKYIKHKISEKLLIEPIGIEPLEKSEGYLFLRQDSEIRIYQYRARIISTHPSGEDAYQDILTHYLYTRSVSLNSPSEQLKYDLVKKHRSLPNPATYQIAGPHGTPLFETLLPLAKERIYNYVNQSFSSEHLK